MYYRIDGILAVFISVALVQCFSTNRDTCML